MKPWVHHVVGLQYYYVLCGGVPLLSNFCLAFLKYILNTEKVNLFFMFSFP